MKSQLSFLLLLCSLSVSSQDVIVKHDGNTVLAKVLEVNPADIKYKKFTNQTGPIYTINKSEVMTINYENGEKDVFTNEKSSNQSIQTSDISYETLANDNLKYIREYNQKRPVFKGNPKRSSDFYIGILGIKEGSVLETPDVKVVFTTNSYGGDFCETISTSLINKTDNIVYVDLGRSFFLSGREYTPYFVPSSSSTGSSETSGIGLNLGAVAGAVGLGGALGTLASGLNLGHSTTTSESKTIYAQRIIAVPPHASVNIGSNLLLYRINIYNTLFSSFLIRKNVPFLIDSGFLSEKTKKYVFNYNKMKNGEIKQVPIVEDAIVSVIITYSKSEDVSNPQSIRTDFFLKEMMGLAKWSYEEIDLSTMPLFFSMRILSPGWGGNLSK